jgi:hypothetical protein
VRTIIAAESTQRGEVSSSFLCEVGPTDSLDSALSGVSAWGFSSSAVECALHVRTCALVNIVLTWCGQAAIAVTAHSPTHGVHAPKRLPFSVYNGVTTTSATAAHRACGANACAVLVGSLQLCSSFEGRTCSDHLNV